MQIIRRITQGASFVAVSGAALAHEGHGMGAVHWHATDLAGLGVVTVLAGLVLWLAKGK